MRSMDLTKLIWTRRTYREPLPPRFDRVSACPDPKSSVIVKTKQIDPALLSAREHGEVKKRQDHSLPASLARYQPKIEIGRPTAPPIGPALPMNVCKAPFTFGPALQAAFPAHKRQYVAQAKTTKKPIAKVAPPACKHAKKRRAARNAALRPVGVWSVKECRDREKAITGHISDIPFRIRGRIKQQVPGPVHPKTAAPQ